jgi:serine/threonine protein kinase
LSTQDVPSAEDLPLPARLRVEQRCTAFERAWRGGERPSIEDFLHAIPAPERRVCLHELVALEMYHRQAAECPLPLEDYLARFPELDRAWLLAARESDSRSAEQTTPFVLLSGEMDPTGPVGGSERLEQKVLRAGKYELVREIGRGGMGVVYTGRQPGLDRLVAVKMILGGGYAGEAARQRFRTEAIAAARLQDEGIARVYDVGEEAGQPYLVMEYIAGGSLRDRLDGTPWPPRQAAALVQRLARTVHLAHQHGIVHRDLKPANVLLTADGRPRITDFGLAKLADGEQDLTRTEEVLGTPSYMAPEQALGKSREVGTAADVYALGAILYELLTGRPPFKGANRTDTLRQVAAEPPAPPHLLSPGIGRDLESVCLKCLEKETRRRYASALALAEDLGRYLQGSPVLARPPGWMDALLRSLRRHDLVATRVWGNITIAYAAVVGATHLSVAWLIATQQPRGLWWLCVALHWLLLGGILAWGLAARRHALTRTEKQQLSLVAGHALATVFLWLALAPSYDRSVTVAYYPAVSVLTGLIFWVLGGVYWGRLYVLGPTFFALAILMRFTPSWAPQEFGLLYAGCMGLIGWYLRSMKEAE